MPLAARLGARGFTLIELVIALAIIGLISLLLFSGLRLGSRAWEAVEKTSEQISGPRLVDGFLTRALSQIKPANAVIDGESLLIFGGDAEHLEFAAPLSQHVGTAGLHILRLGLESLDASSALVLTHWSLHPEVLEGGDDFPSWEPLREKQAVSLADSAPNMDAADGAFGRALLLRDVTLFEVSYYGQLDGASESEWHEEWLGQMRLPSLVRIRLETGTQSWPDLVLALPTLP